MSVYCPPRAAHDQPLRPSFPSFPRTIKPAQPDLRLPSAASEVLLKRPRYDAGLSRPSATPQRAPYRQPDIEGGIRYQASPKSGEIISRPPIGWGDVEECGFASREAVSSKRKAPHGSHDSSNSCTSFGELISIGII